MNIFVFPLDAKKKKKERKKKRAYYLFRLLKNLKTRNEAKTIDQKQSRWRWNGYPVTKPSSFRGSDSHARVYNNNASLVLTRSSVYIYIYIHVHIYIYINTYTYIYIYICISNKPKQLQRSRYRRCYARCSSYSITLISNESHVTFLITSDHWSTNFDVTDMSRTWRVPIGEYDRGCNSLSPIMFLSRCSFMIILELRSPGITDAAIGIPGN